jgi:hypothetical protein
MMMLLSYLHHQRLHLQLLWLSYVLSTSIRSTTKNGMIRLNVLPDNECANVCLGVGNDAYDQHRTVSSTLPVMMAPDLAQATDHIPSAIYH